MENLGKKCRERDRDHDREMARPGDTLRERTGKLESEAEGPRVRNREAHRERDGNTDVGTQEVGAPERDPERSSQRERGTDWEVRGHEDTETQRDPRSEGNRATETHTQGNTGADTCPETDRYTGPLGVCSHRPVAAAEGPGQAVFTVLLSLTSVHGRALQLRDGAPGGELRWPGPRGPAGGCYGEAGRVGRGLALGRVMPKFPARCISA